MDEGDDDLARFVSYMAAALQRIHPQIGETLHAVMGAAKIPPVETLAVLLINDILATGIKHSILVLDDYQKLTNQRIHDFMIFFLEHKPPQLHVALICRSDPSFPLARWRVQGELNEIRERDLRFECSETAQYLNDAMHLNLSNEAIALLEQRTEGWIAGLHLAALSLRNSADPQGFIESFRGSHRHVIDYLAEEVWQRQPERIRAFLSQTSILDHLSASLCEAITGQSDSHLILRELEQANLFVIPFGNGREWFRYHALFAEFLRTTLDKQHQTALHQRAMVWYETQGMWEQAINHALLAGALDDAERLIENAAESLIYNGNLSIAQRWINALPDSRVRANWQLAMYKGWLLVVDGNIDVAQQYADEAEAHLQEPADRGKLLVLRCSITIGRQDYELATHLASEALDRLAPDQLNWRLLALWELAEAQERTRPITEAVGTLYEANRVGRMISMQPFAVIITSFLAAALNHHTQRHDAVTVCQQVVHERVTPASSHLLSRLGMLYYEANMLEEARQYAEQGITLSEHFGFSGVLSFSQGVAALVRHAQGETSAALELLRQARQFDLPLGDLSWLDAEEVNIRLSQGDLPYAVNWAAGISLDDEIHYLKVETQLTLARVLLAQGRLSEAAHWLSRLEQFTWERSLLRWLITVHILQALTAERLGQENEYLALAVESAAPQDYYRAFLDEDPLVLALLPRVRRAAPLFVDQLLHFADPGSPRPVQPLVDPLSDRELDVLRLLAVGLSNQEIAQELVITTGTVKRHVHSILGKLDVNSRSQAAAKARQLGLLV
ncbi:MAG TPA: LuxR C-terminal-related transcriptional regulator [Aggregatilineaceae bacterium]|nr:LuxR C-terminal-related transcriptional regulator [Aggregatilineaceae bacterium]